MPQPQRKPDAALTSTHKSLAFVAVKAAGDGSPSTEDLAAINAYTLSDLAADQVYCRTVALAHNAIDRDREVLDEALLADMARTLPGKGLFRKHPAGWDGDSGPGVGKFFRASVRRMSFDEARRLLGEPDLQWPPAATEAHLLEAGFYMARHADNAALIADIDAGVAGYVSAGFRHSSPVGITDGESDAILAWRLMAPGEALEGSLVWLGAQPGARVIKGAKTHEQTTEESDMDPKELQAKCGELEGDLKVANAKIETLKAAETALATVKSVLGEDLSDTALKALKAQADDGAAYRAGLVDELVSAKRLTGVLGDDAAAVDAAKAFYFSQPMALLKAEHAAAIKAVPGGKQQLTGGDPNQNPGDDKPKGLRDASVTSKALGESTHKAA